jgi:hypothetical protein
MVSGDRRPYRRGCALGLCNEDFLACCYVRFELREPIFDRLDFNRLGFQNGAMLLF